LAPAAAAVVEKTEIVSEGPSCLQKVLSEKTLENCYKRKQENE